ncbi:hypothetical protein ABMA27_015854 [Loxostege sticticalis]|uniref:LITAF domain-containing protein n=1 Tax=Loxostege sticticalis TaxID=481309 RepID=A0ABR3I4L3_LOXSC
MEMNAPGITPLGAMGPVGPSQMMVTCPSCLAPITTRVEHKPNTKTHMIALAMCVFMLWCCAWIPYVKDSCQNADHYCPNCSAYLGSYKN